MFGDAAVCLQSLSSRKPWSLCSVLSWSELSVDGLKKLPVESVDCKKRWVLHLFTWTNVWYRLSHAECLQLCAADFLRLPLSTKWYLG